MAVRYLLLFFVLLAFGGVAASQTAKEPVYKPVAPGKNVDGRMATGTVTVAGKWYRLRLVASPPDEATGKLSGRSVLTIFTDAKPARQIGRVLLPEGVPFMGRWDDISVHYLSPKQKSGVIVSVQGSGEWVLITFPKGFRGKGYAQVFSGSSSSIAARTFQWGELDRKGNRTVREEYSESGGDNGEVITHVWGGTGFAPPK